MKATLRKLIDPIGPIGEFASPSDIYKTRLGLPIQTAHSQRAVLETSAQVERTIAPTKFIEADRAVVPTDRVRQVSAFIQEVWEPVYGTTDSTNFNDIVLASQKLIGWNVRQERRSAYCDCTKATFSREADGEFIHRACGRARKHLTAQEFEQVLASMQVQPTDDFYNQLIETVPGNDPVIFEGKLLRGEPVYDAQGRMVHDGIVRGTMITNGRKEYNQRTKGYIHWDSGFLEKRKEALAEEASRPIRNVRRAMEAVAGEKLPTWRPVGINFRRDRRSAV